MFDWVSVLVIAAAGVYLLYRIYRWFFSCLHEAEKIRLECLDLMVTEDEQLQFTPLSPPHFASDSCWVVKGRLGGIPYQITYTRYVLNIFEIVIEMRDKDELRIRWREEDWGRLIILIDQAGDSIDPNRTNLDPIREFIDRIEDAIIEHAAADPPS
jgi:hypothetical protein